MSAIHILGIRIDDITLDDACAHAAALIEQGGAHQFATVNPEFVMTARHNPAFRAALEHSALNVPDGVGIMLAARWQGRPLRERVTGVALLQRLCALAAERGWGVYLLGAAPGVAERAAAALTARHPALRIVGTHAGSPAPAEQAGIAERISAAQPQFLFVAYGAPAQDVWLHQVLRDESRVPSHDLGFLPPDSGLGTHPAALGLIGMGVGGTFDYLAGVRKLAPTWVRRIGFEWLHRLLQQPSRWRRQLSLLRFAGAVLTEHLKDQR
jgi:N-acetylglucosaminyldiphosphoundecaprenol N-acetyl-beta-D-mannosaminyltransferase